MAERPDEVFETMTAERDTWRQAAFEAQRFAARTAIERQHLSDAFEAIRVQALETARRHAEAELTAAFAAIRDERDRARAAVDAMAAERDRIVAERDRTIAERDRARVEARDTGAMLERVMASTAWRMTGPARRVLQAVLRR